MRSRSTASQLESESSGPLFRFDVPPQTNESKSPDSLFKELIEQLLRVVTLTSNGLPVRPDGFVFYRDTFNTEAVPIALSTDRTTTGGEATTKQIALLNGRQERAQAFYDLNVLRRTEPRFEFAVKLAQVLNEHFEFSSSAGAISSLTVREPAHWTQESSGDPFEVLGVLSRRCNARCQFCYVLGNPANSTVQLNRRNDEQALAEAEERLKHFRLGRALPQPTYDLEEILIHPDAIGVMGEVRKHTATPIALTTNGYLLSDEVLDRLQALEPIEISLSLNAVTPNVRKRLMGGRYLAGLESLEKLHRRRIRTSVTLVAWPSVAISEMESTIRWADQFDVRCINVILGGYTRLFPNPPAFEPFEYWSEVVDALAPLRAELRNALIIQPRVFEERRQNRSVGEAWVTGVVPRSRAHRAGMRFGDLITAINGNRVASRLQCEGALGWLAEKQASVARIEVFREGSPLELTIELGDEDPDYLYGLPRNDRLGIFLVASGIPLSAFQQIYRIADYYSANRVGIVTSKVCHDLVVELLQQSAFLSDRPIHFELIVPDNEYYGGNIILGDLYTVTDIRRCVERLLERDAHSIDLLLVPSASFNFGGWWRDISGEPFLTLQSTLPIPVEMIISGNFE